MLEEISREDFPAEKWNTDAFQCSVLNSHVVTPLGPMGRRNFKLTDMKGLAEMMQAGNLNCTSDAGIRLEGTEKVYLFARAHAALKSGVIGAQDSFADKQITIPSHITTDVAVVQCFLLYIHCGIFLDVHHLTQGTGDLNYLCTLPDHIDLLASPIIKFDIFELASMAHFLDMPELNLKLFRCVFS